MRRFRRRTLLLGGLLAGLASACVRVAPRAQPTAAPTSTPETDAWVAAAQALVGDALATLRTFEDFQAYRASITADSGQRPANSLVWDPPTGAAWDAATHVSRGLHDRANQLFQAITTAEIDPQAWRTQREMADLSHELINLGDGLSAYRDRVDRVRPGDASGALELLDAAWRQFDAVAGRLGMARSELVRCGA